MDREKRTSYLSGRASLWLLVLVAGCWFGVPPSGGGGVATRTKSRLCQSSTAPPPGSPCDTHISDMHIVRKPQPVNKREQRSKGDAIAASTEPAARLDLPVCGHRRTASPAIQSDWVRHHTTTAGCCCAIRFLCCCFGRISAVGFFLLVYYYYHVVPYRKQAR